MRRGSVKRRIRDVKIEWGPGAPMRCQRRLGNRTCSCARAMAGLGTNKQVSLMHGSRQPMRTPR